MGHGFRFRQRPWDSLMSRNPVFSICFIVGPIKWSTAAEAFGLGLSLCKSIVTAHGGTISVSDNQPNGTAFKFTLPAEEVELHE